jgi:hypothetical protein
MTDDFAFAQHGGLFGAEVAVGVDLYFEALGLSFEKYNLDFASEASQIA